MKLKIRSPKASAFTLIEMIGVLAVIAILASLLIPKVFEAINDARVNSAAVGCNTVKTAVTYHFAKFGTLLSNGGVALTTGVGAATNFDKVLVSEGYLDKAFIVKIGDGSANTRIEIVPGQSSATAATPSNTAYDLDGIVSTPLNDAGPAGSSVVQAVITGVAEIDAKDLNDRLDGASLGVALGNSDAKGRVKYAAGATTTVYIYLTHR